jgi:hypothetical protein
MTNRQIKFRVWDTENKEWVTSNDIHPLTPTHQSTNYFRNLLEQGCLVRNSFNELVMPDKLVIQQFTGSKDKNGKEIYEGDVLCVGDNYKDLGLVISNWCAGNIWHDYMEPEEQLAEIIGNNMENPELLERIRVAKENFYKKR